MPVNPAPPLRPKRSLAISGWRSRHYGSRPKTAQAKATSSSAKQDDITKRRARRFRPRHFWGVILTTNDQNQPVAAVDLNFGKRQQPQLGCIFLLAGLWLVATHNSLLPVLKKLAYRIIVPCKLRKLIAVRWKEFCIKIDLYNCRWIVRRRHKE